MATGEPFVKTLGSFFNRLVAKPSLSGLAAQKHLSEVGTPSYQNQLVQGGHTQLHGATSQLSDPCQGSMLQLLLVIENEGS